MTLAIDFDRTLMDTYHPQPGFKLGPPMPGAVEIMSKLKAAGHILVIHTCRANDGGAAVVTVEKWLDYFKIPFDYVWASEHGAKPVADFYIDDKGLRFVDWPKVQESLKYMGVQL